MAPFLRKEVDYHNPAHIVLRPGLDQPFRQPPDRDIRLPAGASQAFRVQRVALRLVTNHLFPPCMVKVAKLAENNQPDK